MGKKSPRIITKIAATGTIENLKKFITNTCRGAVSAPNPTEYLIQVSVGWAFLGQIRNQSEKW
jgi:hypothetical protein